jgi:chemotaxis protein methyltransferase CheR
MAPVSKVTSNAWTGLAAGLAVEELETELLLEALFQRFGYEFRGYDRTYLRAGWATPCARAARPPCPGCRKRYCTTRPPRPRCCARWRPSPSTCSTASGHTQRLRTVLAPALRAWPVPRVWLAECAGVGEAWGLAIVLAEEGVLGKLDIHATLANEDLVAEMQDAWLPVAELDAAQTRYAASGGHAALSMYFEVRDGQARLQPQLRRRITWSQYSLVTDASFNEFQAILCCGALSDFGPVLRQRVLRLFHDSLARFGVLCLDRPLAMSDSYAGTYQAIEGDRPWYKRVG